MRFKIDFFKNLAHQKYTFQPKLALIRNSCVKLFIAVTEGLNIYIQSFQNCNSFPYFDSNKNQ